MKTFFILALCCPFIAQAITFGKHKSDPAGSVAQVYKIEGTEALYERNTNMFDVASKDYRIGRLRLKSEKLKIVYEDLVAFEKKLALVDKELKKKKTSFNEVAGKPGHRTIIVVGDYRIMPESTYYPELEQKFNELQALDWNLEQGYRISPDLSLVYVYRSGKMEKTEKYLPDGYCKESKKECSYSEGGRLFITR